MSSTSHSIAPGLPFWLGPVGWLGKGVISVLAYLGGLARFVAASAVSLVRLRRREDDLPGFWAVMKGELWWILLMGCPLVGLVHVAMGSFLSLQAYFGSTFVDGTGAVVGVGLLRNLGGMMTGMTLSGILAARMIPELRRSVRVLASDEHRRPVVPASPALHGPLAAPRIA